MQRTDFVKGMVGLLPFMTAFFGKAEPVHARYSTYTRREQEWNERTDNGKKPLTNREELVKAANEKYYDQTRIAQERDRKFYANTKPRKCIGQTSAVSPLMENACVEIQEPVVSQRAQDGVGNYILGKPYTAKDEDGKWKF